MHKEKTILKDISCWVITEGMAGTENQCLGITDALGLEAVIKHVKLRFPWRELSPYLRLLKNYAFANNSDSFPPPFPDIVIASGRKSIIPALYIKEASNNKTIIIQIQDPRCNPKLFDLVVVPQHDPTRGNNVIVTTGALHRITNDKLKEAIDEFPTLTKLKRKKIAVLIGGNSKSHLIDEKTALKITEQLRILSENYDLMVTASRRTPDNCQKIIKEGIQNTNGVFFWNGEGKNPYFAFLALADIILVTEDSVSMTSEAISTGKPVYIVKLQKRERKQSRIDKFHSLLVKQGYTRKLPNISSYKLLDSWKYTPSRDTIIVADKIIKILKERKTK